MVTARLERYINAGTAHINRTPFGMMQGMRFRMRETSRLCMPFSEDITIAHNHATDPGIRGRGIEGFGGLRERSAHAIGIGENLHIVSISRDTTF